MVIFHSGVFFHQSESLQNRGYAKEKYVSARIVSLLVTRSQPAWLKKKDGHHCD